MAIQIWCWRKGSWNVLGSNLACFKPLNRDGSNGQDYKTCQQGNMIAEAQQCSVGYKSLVVKFKKNIETNAAILIQGNKESSAGYFLNSNLGLIGQKIKSGCTNS